MSTSYKGPPPIDLTPGEAEKCRALGFHYVAHDPESGAQPLPRQFLTPGLLASLRERWAREAEGAGPMAELSVADLFLVATRRSR